MRLRVKIAILSMPLLLVMWGIYIALSGQFLNGLLWSAISLPILFIVLRKIRFFNIVKKGQVYD